MAVETRSETPAAVGRVLVGDDQQPICEALALLLKGFGYSVSVASSPAELLSLAMKSQYDLVLMDMNYARDTTSGEEGLDLLDRLHTLDSDMPVVVMTAWSTVELAVMAMQRGACDFVTKPWDNRRLVETISKQIHRAQSQRRTNQQQRSEKDIARDVQSRLLPSPHQNWGTIRCECACRAARDVSGDLYDFLEAGPGQHAFLLGDVCGKGVGSALMMANLQATLRAEWDHEIAPESFLRHVNRLFHASTRPEHFATLFFGIVDENSGRLRYVNCGHLAPILVRNNAAVERLEPTGTVLGAFNDAEYECASTFLNRGDTLVIFSDGVIEAEMAGGEEFGDDRLVESVIRGVSSGPVHLISGILSEVLPDHTREQFDDVTMMVITAE
jgi:phosphoserine phosphatase RsbU/P